MNYNEFKFAFIERLQRENTTLTDGLYSFCEELSKTDIRWFQTEVGNRPLYAEVQDGGTHWKTIQYEHADKLTIEVGRISQLAIFHGKPITKEEFERTRKQAMARLLRTSK